MATLTDAVKTFIVQRLAMYDTQTQVAEAVKEEFDGLVVTRQQVDVYNPDRTGQKPAKRWCDLHAATRAEFLRQTAKIPVANRAVRIRRLDRMATAAEGRKNYVLAAALLEQIAKEVGKAYTNKTVTKVKGDADAPLVFVPATGGPPKRGDQADE